MMYIPQSYNLNKLFHSKHAQARQLRAKHKHKKGKRK